MVIIQTSSLEDKFKANGIKLIQVCVISLPIAKQISFSLTFPLPNPVLNLSSFLLFFFYFILILSASDRCHNECRKFLRTTFCENGRVPIAHAISLYLIGQRLHESYLQFLCKPKETVLSFLVLFNS